MVALFVALMFVGLVLTDFGLQKVKAYRAARALRPLMSAAGVRMENLWQVPEGVHLSSGHTWSRPDPAGVEIGADLLIAHALGAVSRVILPKPGDQVSAGQPLFRLERDGRTLNVPAPFTGRVANVNSRLEAQPALLTSDPFGGGWVCLLTPTQLDEPPATMLFGEKAIMWAEREFNRLQVFVFGQVMPDFALGATLPDGGPLAPGCLGELDSKAWSAFESEFLKAK